MSAPSPPATPFLSPTPPSLSPPSPPTTPLLAPPPPHQSPVSPPATPLLAPPPPHLSPPSSPATPLLAPPPPRLLPPPLSYSSSSVSSGLIAGIAVGTVLGVFFLFMLVILIFLFFRKWLPRSDEYDFFRTFHRPPPPSEPYSPSWQANPLLFAIYLYAPPSLPANNSGGSGSDSGPKPNSIPENLPPFSVPPSVVAGGPLRYEDLKLATNGFAQSNLLGQGEFGFVYRGTLMGKEVAIKKLKPGGGQGDIEFREEVEIISRMHHQNLGSLVGYCVRDQDKKLLVYEFVPNKTLDFHLHGSGRPTLNWLRRWKIALGSAKGLAYLHEHCDPKIIHRNIKATNILLDYNFEPKVSDFGLTKFVLTNKSHVSAREMGSFGYVAPEYAATGTLTDRSDVYAYGVMLLELITGRKPVMDSDPHMDQSLVNWARPLLLRDVNGDFYDELIDPRLETNYDSYDMTRLIHCAAAAVRQLGRKRPRMSQIVQYLEGEVLLEERNAWPGLMPGDNMVKDDSTEQEAFCVGIDAR